MVGPAAHATGIGAGGNYSGSIAAKHSKESSARLICAICRLDTAGGGEFGIHECSSKDSVD